MAIEVVLFDLDDTLVDHRAAMDHATAMLYATVKAVSSPNDFAARWKDSHTKFYPKFLRGEMPYQVTARSRVREVIDSCLDDAAADQLFDQYLEWYEQAWRLFPDVIPCLESLCHLRLGVISNGRAIEQRRKLNRLSLERYFAHVTISEEIGIAKPSAGIFHRVCDLMGVDRRSVVYVGDQRELDACAARDAGLQAVWLNRLGPSGDIENVVVVETLATLPEVLNQPHQLR